LKMSCCNQDSITDKAFSYLTGIHKLKMVACHQKSITDKAFSYLTGIHTMSK